MSGGHFDYSQYTLEDIAEEIEDIIAKNNDTSIDEYGSRVGYGFTRETIDRLKECSHTLRQAADMAQRVDWQLPGHTAQHQN